MGVWPMTAQGEKCRTCAGTGEVVEYFGLEMRPVGVPCHDCNVCSDCPPMNYPTENTRCLACPRRSPTHDRAQSTGSKANVE